MAGEPLKGGEKPYPSGFAVMITLSGFAVCRGKRKVRAVSDVPHGKVEIWKR